MSKLARICLAQPGYGSALLPLLHCHPNRCSTKFYFGSTVKIPLHTTPSLRVDTLLSDRIGADFPWRGGDWCSTKDLS